MLRFMIVPVIGLVVLEAPVQGRLKPLGERPIR